LFEAILGIVSGFSIETNMCCS